MSSTVPILHLPDLTQADMYRLFNKKACDAILPVEFKRIIEWGCPKNLNETFLEFLQKKYKDSWSKYKKLWNSSDMQRLDSPGCDGYDVSILQKLIPEVCDNIPRIGSQTSNLVDESCIECVLKKLKDLRNAIMHEPDVAAIDPNTMQEMERLLIKLIELSSKLYSKPQVEVDAKISDLKTKFQDLENMFVTDKDKLLSQIRIKLCTEGMSEMKANWQKFYDQITLPVTNASVSINDVFYGSTLQLYNENGVIHQEIPCEDIFTRWASPNEYNNLFFIQGEAGSGKTTMLRAIALNFFNDGRYKFRSIENFELLLYIRAREYSIVRLTDLVSHTFKATTIGLEVNDVISAMMNMNTLVLVDGYDEVNQDSDRFIQELILKYRSANSTTIIITTRPFAMIQMQNFLDDTGMRYSSAKIKEIKELDEQKIFLARYSRVLHGLHKVKILNSFMNMRDDVRQHFMYPIQLVLHCHLCIHTDVDVTKCTDETDMMREMLELCRTMVFERLQLQGFDCLETTTFLNSLYVMSLRCLHKNKLFLSEEDCEELREEVNKKLQHRVSCHPLLSCVLVADHFGMQKPGTVTYTYFHKSQQEFLAAKAIIARVLNRPHSCLTNIISRLLNEEFCPRVSFCQYENVIKFLIWDLENSEKLADHKEQLTLFLKQCHIKLSYCHSLVLSCKSNFIIMNTLMSGCRDSHRWLLTSEMQMEASINILKFYKPRRIVLKLKESLPPILKNFLIVLKEYFDGALALFLNYSHREYMPCDDFVTILKGSKFHVKCLTGCVESKAAMDILADLKISKLELSLRHGLSHHLYQMQNRTRELKITIRYDEYHSPAYRPLPQGSKRSTFLIVDNVPLGATNGLESLIRAVMPKDKKFSQLLLKRTYLLDENLYRIVHKLQQVQVQTSNSKGDIRFEAWHEEEGRCLLCSEHHAGTNTRCLRLHLVNSSYTKTETAREQKKRFLSFLSRWIRKTRN